MDLNKACPKDSYPLPQNRYLSRLNCKKPAPKFHGRFLRLQPDQNGRSWSRKDFFYDKPRIVLLQGDAIWTQKCWGDIPEVNEQNVRTPDWKERINLCWRHVSKESARRRSLSNLRETFDTLWSYNMKLNPNKCAFRVTAGKFLGFMVSQRGIEVNPEKMQAIMELKPPRTVKKVQSLNGKIAALNRFVSRAMDRCLPFFCTLRRSFKWTDECQTTFDNLKTYISSSLLLSSSKPGEELYLYLAVS